jgi:hypothetical protein
LQRSNFVEGVREGDEERERERERERDVIIFLQSMSYERVSIRKTTFDGGVYHFECAFLSMYVLGKREREREDE